MNSALGRLRRAFVCSLLTIGLVSTSQLYAQDAPTPASVPTKINVTIQPASGTAQKATCGDTYKCSMDVSIQAAGKAQTLTVDVFYAGGGTLITFRTPDGYLYAGETKQADPQHPQYAVMWPAPPMSTQAS